MVRPTPSLSVSQSRPSSCTAASKVGGNAESAHRGKKVAMPAKSSRRIGMWKGTDFFVNDKGREAPQTDEPYRRQIDLSPFPRRRRARRGESSHPANRV